MSEHSKLGLKQVSIKYLFILVMEKRKADPLPVKTVLKAAVSAILLTSILFMVDLRELALVLKKVEIKYVFIAVFFAFLRTFIGFYRLFFVLERLFEKVSMSKVFKDSLIAGFYNLFLPTVLGGDVPKILLLNRHLKDKKKIAASVFTERFLGFFSLIVLALLSTSILYVTIESNKGLLLSIIGIFLVFIITFVLLQKLSLSERLEITELSLASKLILVLGYVKGLRAKHLCVVFFQSLLYQSLGIILVYFLGRALGMQLCIIQYFIAVPLVWFTIMIPVSISGVGLREGAFIYFFNLFGVNQELSLGLSILFYLQNLIIGSVGGILLLSKSISHDVK